MYVGELQTIEYGGLGHKPFKKPTISYWDVILVNGS
jgi:hypothetical protein